MALSKFQQMFPAILSPRDLCYSFCYILLTPFLEGTVSCRTDTASRQHNWDLHPDVLTPESSFDYVHTGNDE